MNQVPSGNANADAREEQVASHCVRLEEASALLRDCLAFGVRRDRERGQTFEEWGRVCGGIQEVAGHDVPPADHADAPGFASCCVGIVLSRQTVEDVVAQLVVGRLGHDVRPVR